MSVEIPTLYTVQQFSEKHPFITTGGLRYQIFNSEENGLEKSGAIIHVGRRVLIDEGKYFKWIGAKNERTN